MREQGVSAIAGPGGIWARDILQPVTLQHRWQPASPVGVVPSAVSETGAAVLPNNGHHPELHMLRHVSDMHTRMQNNNIGKL